MAVFQVKKYKTIKDEKRNKIQVEKTKEEWNKETKNGTATWYFVDWYTINEIKKQYKSRMFELKRDAEAEERLFLADPIKYILEHSKRAKSNLKYEKSLVVNKTLNEYFEDYKLYYIEYIRDGTIYGQENNWNTHFKDEIGNLTPSDLDLPIMKQLHIKLNAKINTKTKQKYATSTKNTWHALLVDFCEYLATYKLIDFNYAKTVGGFKDSKKNTNEHIKIRYQTEEEFNLFMSVVDDPFWYKFFNFLFWHGPRKGEQRALKIADIELEYNNIIFDETIAKGRFGNEIIGPIKNGKIREIYLSKQSRLYIKELIDFYKQMDGYSEEWFLFGGPINTNKNRINRALTHYYDKLQELYSNRKIVRLSHHEFGRHSHASYLLNEGLKKGIPIEEIYAIIAQRLGDTIETIKKTYAHLYEKENNDKAKKILN